MKDLFDYISGTSTGAILATALALKKEGTVGDPKFWGKECVQIYIDGGPDIFQQNKLGKALQVFMYLIFVIVFAGLFFLCGNYKYNNAEKRKALKNMNKFLQEEQDAMAKRLALEANSKKSTLENNFDIISEEE
jgi:flagellar biosynthesis/type III secretory pathway M-ring protein FliF/YscJ